MFQLCLTTLLLKTFYRLSVHTEPGTGMIKNCVIILIMAGNSYC